MATKCCIPVMFIRFLATSRLANRYLRNCCVVLRFATPASASPSGLMELNEMAFTAFGEVAERLRRSTVLIRSGLRANGSGSGSGSGVIWSDSGLIVTNAHVIRGSHACLQLWDGREFEAQVTERDHSRDLAAF